MYKFILEEEAEFWLNYIKEWTLNRDDLVPEQVLQLRDEALERLNEMTDSFVKEPYFNLNAHQPLYRYCEIIFTSNLVELFSQHYTVDIFSQTRKANGV
ncbi:MAG: hypothetical protein DRQ62_04305 [Gammaproteobacteria bacterium]|nr:MAG: hypothetical protein DRQ62_04305 [Gammaproteobacteria bacterium]